MPCRLRWTSYPRHPAIDRDLDNPATRHPGLIHETVLKA